MTALKKTVGTRTGVEPMGGNKSPMAVKEPPVHRSSSAQLDPIPNCLILATARQDN